MTLVARTLVVSLVVVLGSAILSLASADAAPKAKSKPHFIVHAHRVHQGKHKGWMRYDVQSSRHWAYDRVWLQIWPPSEKACYPKAKFTKLHRWVTIYKKTANKKGHVAYWIIATKKCARHFRERFYSPPAPGFPVEKSPTFHPRLKTKG